MREQILKIIEDKITACYGGRDMDCCTYEGQHEAADEIEKLIKTHCNIHNFVQAKPEQVKNNSSMWLLLDCTDDGTWLVKNSESKKVEWSGGSILAALEYIYRNTICHVC